MPGSGGMVEWLKLLGHSSEDLRRLNAIHVAGTKGKGSICAFIASLLKAHGDTTIRINGEPISKDLFTTRFFEVWDKLPAESTPNLGPRYLQFLALLSFHVFIEEGVDVAIYETHLGGEVDATNIIEMPTVTAITLLAMDHVNLLGPTIEKIAWHKAGIFKSGSVALSTLQEPAAKAVLQQRADEKDVLLGFVGLDPTIPANAIALKPKPQRMNCSLALAVVRAWLAEKAINGQSITERDIARGVDQFFWPGRYQQISDRRCQWFLDGAHNEISLQYVGDWFAEAAAESHQKYNVPRILIFGHYLSRDGIGLLRALATSLQDNGLRMQHVIFSSVDERKDGQKRIDRNVTRRFSPELQKRYAEFGGNLIKQRQYHASGRSRKLYIELGKLVMRRTACKLW